jgi:Na+/proline symporter
MLRIRNLRIRLTTARYNNELQTSELFSTAGRTVKSGLVASAVVSSWTWAATLLTSSGVAYRYGVSGPLWVRLPENRLFNRPFGRLIIVL